MEELVNFFIELANALKYGQWLNRNRLFDRQIKEASLIEGKHALDLRMIVEKQLSKLLIKGNGEPTYAYFESRKDKWHKIFIINSNKGFYCRLRDERIETSIKQNKFYIVL